MDPRLIGRLKRGQAEECDRRLAALLIERGILTPDEAHELRGVAEAGAFGEMLVRSGRLTDENCARFAREAGLREIFDTVIAANVPAEVAAAADDTRLRVSKYLRIEKLGEGGMGEVWKAWDNHLGRWVALKFLKGQDTDEIKRFLREANLASQLSHPGIPRVYEVGVPPHRPYIALELIDGRSLEGSKLIPREAAQIVRDAARAADYAHEQGIIHRDLKPANIMKSRDGRIYVTDFGLARAAAPGGTLTASGAAMGTPAFMSPEQASGKGATKLSDVYGLGATLYALVEGIAPHGGDDAYEVMRRIVDEPAPRLPLKDDLTAIAQKSMEREPADRYTSARDLADDLDRYLQGDPIAARPIGAARLVLRKVRRHPWVSALILLGAFGLGVFIAWRAISERERQKREAAEAARRRRVNEELSAAMRLLPDIQRLHSAATPEGEMLNRVLKDFHEHVYAALYQAPDNLEAHYYCGLLHYLQQEYPDAEKHFTTVLGLDPAHNDARMYRGFARLSQTVPPYNISFDEAGVRMIYVPPSGAEARLVEAAVEDINALPANFPGRADCQALVLFARGESQKALDTLRRVLRDRPFLLDVRHRVAVAELEARNYVQAEIETTRAIELGLRGGDVFGIRAFARAGQKRYKEAAEDAENALASRPEWKAQRHLLAQLRFHLRQYDLAIRECDRLLKESPATVRVLLLRSESRLGMGDRARAGEDAGEACRLEPNNAHAHIARGRALQNSDEAIAAFTRAIALESNCAQAHTLRANLHFLAGRKVEARRDYVKAVDIEPENPDWHHLLGLNYYDEGQYAECAQEMSAVLKLRPDDPDAFCKRGQARYLMSDFKNALEDFESAVSRREDLRPILKDAMEDCRKRLQK